LGIRSLASELISRISTSLACLRGLNHINENARRVVMVGKSEIWTEPRIGTVDVTVKHRGIDISFDLSSLPPSGMTMLLHEISLNDCYELDSVRTTCPVVVDIGAHIGILGLAATTRFVNGTYIAIEADPLNFGYLTRNVSQWRSLFPEWRFETVNSAAADDTGTLKIVRSSSVDWRSSPYLSEEYFSRAGFSPGEFTDVGIIPSSLISSILKPLLSKKINILKCTIAGGNEVSVIRASANYIAEHVSDLCAFYVYEENRSAMESLMTQIGFRFVGRKRGNIDFYRRF